MNHSNELSNVEKIKQLVDYLNLQRGLMSRKSTN